MPAADGPRRLDVGVLHHRQGGAADDARVVRGHEHGERQDQVQESRPEHGHERQDDDQIREGHPGIDDALDGHVVGPADVGARHPDGHRHHGGQRDGEEAHGHRHARPVHDAAPEIAGEVVRSEPELGARRLHARSGDGIVVVVVGDPGGAQRHDEHDEHEESAEGAQGLVPAELHDGSQGARERPGLSRGLHGGDGFDVASHGRERARV